MNLELINTDNGAVYDYCKKENIGIIVESERFEQLSSAIVKVSEKAPRDDYSYNARKYFLGKMYVI